MENAKNEWGGVEPSGAIFSENKVYRYALWRLWDRSKPIVAFVGLNPSTADEFRDDPTIRRVKSFAQSWGFGGVVMLNLFALVTPKPKELDQCHDPIGHNDAYLLKNLGACDAIIFAWGGFKQAKERGKWLSEMFPGAKALVVNSDGSPSQPLYVKGDTIPVLFRHV